MNIINQFVQETEAMAASASNVVSFREARAKRIRELGNKWAECTFQLGQELEAVKSTFSTKAQPGFRAHVVPGGWEEWLDKEVGIGLRYAESLIQIWKKFGNNANSLSGATFRVLQYLARDTIPESARDEALGRIQSGEKIGKETAQEIVKQHRPSPEEARKIARDTGRPTLARDGNIYLGATKEQEQQIEARREMVYGVRHAIEALATVGVPADKFLKQALPHQLWNAKEEHLIDEALGWLTDLKTAWERR